MMHFGYYPYGGLYDGGMGWLFMALWWILIIVVVAVLIRWLMHYSDNTGRHWHKKDMREETPLEILKKRYAAGEIDKQEFEEKKKDLEIV
jgi:putative membrane protein